MQPRKRLATWPRWLTGTAPISSSCPRLVGCRRHSLRAARAPATRDCLIGVTPRRASRHYARVPLASWPQLHDLIWLFEAEPEIEFEDIGWPVSQVTFVTARASWTVICTIAPYMYTVDLRLGQDDEDVVRLRLPEVVQAVEVDRTHGAEALVVSFERDSRAGALRLQLKPTVVDRMMPGVLPRSESPALHSRCIGDQPIP